MRVATIDIGTNSVLLLVAERGADGALVPVVERATITRLGEGVDRTGELSEAARERTLSCLARYADEARQLGASRIVAVGTSAMRDARGGAAFAEAAEGLLGERPRVIGGEEEARLTFVGAVSGLSLEGEVAVVDVGGGSTELVVGELSGGEARVIAAASVNVGSVRMTERHVKSDPPGEAELSRMRDDIDRALEGLPQPGAGVRLVGVAGTVTTLAAIEQRLAVYDGGAVHGSKLSRGQLEGLVSRLAAIPLSERRQLAGLEPKRADVIVAGGTVVQQVVRRVGASELLVSDRGVRWGLLHELVSKGA